ncbi:MAG TPA: CRTAC1 family protein [Terriglobales bacterium]|nr:CRTAC1 family protein [Terriglobales bacterium]
MSSVTGCKAVENPCILRAGLSRRRFLAALSTAAAGHLLPQRLLADKAPAVPIFSDVTAEAGLTWRQFNGFSPDRHLIETMGGGVGLFDFDNDGWLDIFLLNGGETPHGKSEKPLQNALYRNLGNGKFEDVAVAAGLSKLKTYGMGVAIADFDNDGHQDVFITGYPNCVLYHNNGDGTFTDVTEDAGLRNAGKWAASAAWFDYDRDGFLDLVICNYVEMSFDVAPRCLYLDMRTYCEQRAYKGVPLTIYHNNRNGTFTDVTRSSGLDRFVGRALGVVALDIDDDGWPDLFVSRDASPNLLLLNKHNGTFADAGVAAEIAYDSNGNAKAGMGVDAGDINGDGRPDFVVGNFSLEYPSLFLSRPGLFFEEAARTAGIGSAAQFNVTWGVHFVDFDNDGSLDIMLVNGHIIEVIESLQPQVKYKERPLLLHNSGNGKFEDVSFSAGPAFAKGYQARGLAVGDFDNDGAPDVIFTCIGDSPVLLRNNVGQKNSWAGVRLIGTKSNRDAIGAKLTLSVADRKLVRWLAGGSSYLSSHDKRIIFGLGTLPANQAVNIEVLWPSGTRQTVTALKINRYHQIVEPS